ncbi:MAG: META domain-containing protein [Candidatus Limnocylindrales bacterium]
MTRTLRVLLLVVMALGTTAGPTPAQDESAGLRLTRSHWRLTRLDGTAIPARAGIELAFSASGRVTGSGGCNELEASWTYLGGDRITMGGFSATRGTCTRDAARVERLLVRRLILATTFTIDGSELSFLTTEGKRLEFRSLGRTGSELVGDWALTAVDGAPAADLPRSTATFSEDGTISGMAGCNQFHGRYTVDDTAIRVRRVLAGIGTCADHVMKQELGLLDGLESAGSWTVDGDTLTIAGARGRGSITLRAVRPVMHELAGTDWTIASVSDGVTATADSTIRFDPSGTVSGWGGCNSFRGPWKLDDDGIVLHIGPLMSTRTKCAWQGVDLEAGYLATLEDVLGYKTPDGAELTLYAASGARITYTPPVIPTLTGGNWHLAMIGDTPFDGMAPVSLTFLEDGSFVGNGGCDMIWGSYELRGDAFRFVDLETGERACEPAVTEFQRSYLGLLPLLDRMAFDGLDLVLFAGDQPVRFTKR